MTERHEWLLPGGSGKVPPLKYLTIRVTSQSHLARWNAVGEGWTLLGSLRRKSACTLGEERVIDAALETISEAKKLVKAGIMGKTNVSPAGLLGVTQPPGIRPTGRECGRPSPE